MNNSCFKINRCEYPLEGSVEVSGAKNAVLVILCSTILTRGKSLIYNVPALLDVFSIVKILEHVGAVVEYDQAQKTMTVDTTNLSFAEIPYTLMNQTRASILVLGPLLVRFGKAIIQGAPGGDSIGLRPVDFHIKNLKKLGVFFEHCDEGIKAHVQRWIASQIVLDYPSIGATENIIMASLAAQGRTTIVNAAIEPEVLDLITVLQLMGASISVHAPATIIVDGGSLLKPFSHTIIPDRLEAGALLIAAAMTGGDVFIPNIKHTFLDLLLLKLEEMGHSINFDSGGIRIRGVKNQRAVSFKTGPFPSFATDLQAPFMAALLTAQGSSVIEETVFENRFRHIVGFQMLGATIDHVHSNKAVIHGVNELNGCHLVPTDIRAACAFVLAGLVAHGQTTVWQLQHFKRGFDLLDARLKGLGASIELVENDIFNDAQKPI
jgi:UDP-N-acetylglucosamine 1-carboxyvinyltransferase